MRRSMEQRGSKKSRSSGENSFAQSFSRFLQVSKEDHSKSLPGGMQTRHPREDPFGSRRDNLLKINRPQDARKAFIDNVAQLIEQDLYTNDDVYKPPPSNCYVDTPSSYTNVSSCLRRFSSAKMPPPCISNTSQLIYGDDGQFSADATFFNCLNNIPDAGSIATYFNGEYNGCFFLATSLTLLNLVRVKYFFLLLSLPSNFVLFRFPLIRSMRWTVSHSCSSLSTSTGPMIVI